MYRRIYEINTRVWLRELVSRGRLARPSLSEIPEACIRRWQNWQIDAVWLMGVWEPSPYSARVARTEAGLSAAFDRALEDYAPEDCVGSPYAVRRYDVSERLGGLAGLLDFRARLKRVGLGLILDFVPNHTACDHPWVTAHPEYYVQAHAADDRQKPGSYFEAQTVEGAKLIAHGRDPYFPPWTDTAQLNYASRQVHAVMQSELLRIAQWCDGVRCDMAMLCLADVFRRTWNRSVALPHEFWADAISAVQQRYPDFCFIAEVYWQLESRLQQLGFTLTYDKEVYDALVRRDVAALYILLQRRDPVLGAGLRFLENHDEPRAAARFSQAQAAAAMLALLTLPGATLLHEGQLEGRQVHTPVQLRRRRFEPMRQQIRHLYDRLLRLPIMQSGTFCLRHPREAWAGNQTFHHVLSWVWRHGEQLWLIVINDADTLAQCTIHLEDLDLPADELLFRDHWQNVDYHRYAADIRVRGLYVELSPFNSHLFEIRRATF